MTQQAGQGQSLCNLKKVFTWDVVDCSMGHFGVLQVQHALYARNNLVVQQLISTGCICQHLLLTCKCFKQTACAYPAVCKRASVAAAEASKRSCTEL